MKLRFEIRDSCRANFNKYTGAVFQKIPLTGQPGILDMGCGTGVSTIFLAGLTEGHITAVDTDSECLSWFRSRINHLGIGHRITVIQDSVLTVGLPEHSFDIIVAEGLLNIIGFETGLDLCSGFLKAGGYCMIHDDAKNRDQKMLLFKKYRFELIYSLYLDEQVWWKEYCSCLEEKIEKLKAEQTGNKTHAWMFTREGSEIDMFRKDPSMFRSRYYLIRQQQT